MLYAAGVNVHGGKSLQRYDRVPTHLENLENLIFFLPEDREPCMKPLKSYLHSTKKDDRLTELALCLGTGYGPRTSSCFTDRRTRRISSTRRCVASISYTRRTTRVSGTTV